MKSDLGSIRFFYVLLAAAVLIAIQAQGQDVDSTVPCVKETFVYKVVDGHEIRADVFRPADREIRPVILWIHGGALIFGSRNGLHRKQMDLYVQGGYVVVAIDYRLVPETKLQAIVEDIKDAYAWVRSKGPDLFQGDPDRIAVIGHSAGGYLTLLAGSRLLPRPMALVSFYGYGELTGSWYSDTDNVYSRMATVSEDRARECVGNAVVSCPSPELNWPEGRAQFYIYCRQQGIWPKEASGHDPTSEKEWFSEYEPLFRVSSDYPPTLLIHGEKDTDVPFEESVLMAAALEKQGVEHEFISNPNWGHMFDFYGMEDPAFQELFDRVLLFLKKQQE